MLLGNNIGKETTYKFIVYFNKQYIAIWKFSIPPQKLDLETTQPFIIGGEVETIVLVHYLDVYEYYLAHVTTILWVEIRCLQPEIVS